MLRRINLLDFLQCSIYEGVMKRLLLISLLIGLAHPALAEELSPIQQYLYDESGYAPGMTQPQPQVAVQPVYPYNTANVAADGAYYYAAPQTQPQGRVQDVNQGALGINN